MALVDYSSSESSESSEDDLTASERGRKRKRGGRDELDVKSKPLPPLPSQFHDLYASSTRLSKNDDPAMHGGRKRVTPHVEGNWATHVYLEWHPLESEYDLLSDILNTYSGAGIQSLLHSSLSTAVPLHISLSRPIVLKTPQKDQFLASLERSISTSGVRQFKIRPTKLKWFPNLEGTRWFLVLNVETVDNGDELETLLETSNTAARSVGQPCLYSKYTGISPGKARLGPNTKQKLGQPSRPVVSSHRQESSLAAQPENQFHVSIGWSLNAPNEELVAQLQSSQVQLQVDLVKAITIPFKDVKIKIGNTVNVVAFPTKADQGKGLIGY